MAATGARCKLVHDIEECNVGQHATTGAAQTEYDTDRLADAAIRIFPKVYTRAFHRTEHD